MHIVLRVADVKNKENCILNGGVNMVGWQRFENEYFPLVNITHPSKTEQSYHMWGIFAPLGIFGVTTVIQRNY